MKCELLLVLLLFIYLRVARGRRSLIIYPRTIYRLPRAPEDYQTRIEYKPD